MHIFGERLNEVLLLGRKLTTLEHLLLEGLHLGVSGELTGKEQPQDTLRDWLTTFDGLGSLGLDFTEGVSTVGDTFHSVELGSLVVHARKTSHASHDSPDSDITDNGGGVLLLEGKDFLLSLGDDVCHLFLEVRSGGECASSNALHR